MSRWSPREAPGEPDGLILFDGVCVFCSRWVRFVIDHDPQGRFTFAPIQSQRGRALAARFGIDPEAPQTNAVIRGGRIWFKSDAALTVLGEVRGTRPLAMLKVLPRLIRDPAYDLTRATGTASFAGPSGAWSRRRKTGQRPSPGG